MINIPMNSKGAYDNNTIASVNNGYTSGVLNAQNIESLNRRNVQQTTAPSSTTSGSGIPAPTNPNPGMQNSGFQNSGMQNPGFQNSGMQNPGFQNSGMQNPGFQNSGMQNPGFQNSGMQNPGFQNSGMQNPGFQNSGMQNPGFQNSGMQNPGFQNSGMQNPGFQNSGMQNPGFQHSGMQNPGFQNSGMQNPGFQNSGMQNPGFQNSGMQNSSMQNSGYQAPAAPAPVTPSPAAQAINTPPVQRQIPQLNKPVQKGQKVALSNTPISAIKACFGWNTTNAECDVDVSAFLLGADGKVLGDTWFVFYGETTSPDQSTQFHIDNTTDCEIVTIDFQKLNANVKKIVFVLTINEAFDKNLNFGMLKDAYVRILDSSTNTELVSFKMTEYYSNVISMMIGEIYNHNGVWKFNAVGNGVARDLEGLCELYGVQVVD